MTLTITSFWLLNPDEESQPKAEDPIGFIEVLNRENRPVIPQRATASDEVDTSFGENQVSVIELLENRTYFSLLSAEVDFLALLDQVKALHAEGNPDATYLFSLLLQQCRDVRRLQPFTATEFIARTQITDPGLIRFYHLRETQCRGLLTENLWIDEFPSTNQLLMLAASGGNSVAMVDLAFKWKRTRRSQNEVRGLLVQAISSLEPLALLRAVDGGAGQSMFSESDTLALVVLACKESADCLASSGLFRDCSVSGGCISGTSLIDHFEMFLGPNAIDTAKGRADVLKTKLLDDGWTETDFDWDE
ncbi:MAG: hypothetical protein AAF662_13330 [Pseudomonadota bacterium]